MNIRETIKRHPVATYFILAFGIAWGGILFVVGPGEIPGSGAQLGRLLPLVFLAMIAGPSVARRGTGRFCRDWADGGLASAGMVRHS